MNKAQIAARSPPTHSDRSTTIGSIRDARRAGSQHASAATAEKKSAILASVPGSYALVWNSRDSMSRPVPSAMTRPNASPRPTSRPPSPITRDDAAHLSAQRDADADFHAALG